ncbi:AraC family transcriptional regulator [Georgenia sp. 311]|uniref:AraC family transcriptional regulator n=1 Tax=Georgenia sp. 311 TaxID=2585134 RepID=UPI00111210CF|nr:helix-turn-helix domain-containing protein [Georgenia sp. 311]TNC20281.1 AraC family transcriptional regulator [Georgenia sp. 311]
MSGLVTHVPPAPLRPLVSSAVGYRAPAFPTGVHRGLPSRHLTLVVELLAPLTVSGMGEPVSAHGVAGGLHTRPALIDASGPQEGLQYGLTPLGSRVLLGVPGGELRDRAVDLADVLGARAARTVERLRAAGGWDERFRLLDTVLLERLAARRWGAEPGPAGVAAEVAEAWRLILVSHGTAPVAAVAAHVGWGRRHLGERFRAATGLTPKEAARVVRFERAQHTLRARPVPLADLAVACGYADQPHLAREWRSLTGTSITAWLREELPFVQDAAARPARPSVP